MSSREYPARPIVGVGGVAIHEGRVALVKRAYPPLQGEWSIPGGGLHVGETIVDGVRREVEEETGLVVSVLDPIEVFERIVRDEAGKVQYHFVVLDYLCKVTGGTLRHDGDALDAAWAGEEELARFSLTETATRVLRKGFAMARDLK